MTAQKSDRVAGKAAGKSVVSKATSKVVAKTKKTPKVAKEKRPAGRPSIYSQALADRICAKLASGQSMRTVCKADDMPHMDTVFSWLREKPDFSEQYVKAKAEAADALVEEMLDIADDGSNDWMKRHGKDGEEGFVVNGEHVQRSRLRVDTRKWIAAKLKPKKYGEKVDLNHDIQPDSPLAKLFEQIQGTPLRPAEGGSKE